MMRWSPSCGRRWEREGRLVTPGPRSSRSSRGSHCRRSSIRGDRLARYCRRQDKVACVVPRHGPHGPGAAETYDPGGARGTIPDHLPPRRNRGRHSRGTSRSKTTRRVRATAGLGWIAEPSPVGPHTDEEAVHNAFFKGDSGRSRRVMKIIYFADTDAALILVAGHTRHHATWPRSTVSSAPTLH